MRKVFITLSFILLSVVGIKAQNENLWHDPGFEETEKDQWTGNIQSKFWNIGGTQIGAFNTETTDVHGGQRAIKIYSESNKFLGMYDDEWDWDRSYPCKVGEHFTLSYWHKGTMKIKGLQVTVRLYDGSNKYKAFKEIVIHNSEIMTQEDKWAQHKVEFKITPEDVGDKTVKHFDVKLKLPYEFNALGHILLDDFSLMLTPEVPPVVLDVPKFEEVLEYEHEIVLEWTKTNDKEITWELIVDNETITTKEPTYTLTQLEENSNHTVKVRAIKGEVKSDFSEVKTVKTRAIDKAKEDEDRLPYLRTIAPDGSVHNQSIALFYNNLYNIKNTKISYKIDGVDVQPTENILKFPKLGMQELEINIVEDATHTWTLNYKLNVID